MFLTHIAKSSKKGKEMYCGHPIFIHAGRIYQKTPYKHDDFYIRLNAYLSEISLLLDVFPIASITVFSTLSDAAAAFAARFTLSRGSCKLRLARRRRKSGGYG